MYSSIQKDLGIQEKGGDGLKDVKGWILIEGRKRRIQKNSGDG